MEQENKCSASSKRPALTLSIVPIDEETDDLDSWALAAQVRDQLASTFREGGAFAVSQMSLSQEQGKARRVEVVLWLLALGETLWANQEVLAALIQLGETVIQTLAKHRRIQRVELTVGEHQLVLKDVREQMVPCLNENTTPRAQEGSHACRSSEKIYSCFSFSLHL